MRERDGNDPIDPIRRKRGHAVDHRGSPIVSHQNRRFQPERIEQHHRILGQMKGVIGTLGDQGVGVVTAKVGHDSSVARLVQRARNSRVRVRGIWEPMKEHHGRPSAGIGVAPRLPVVGDELEVRVREHVDFRSRDLLPRFVIVAVGPPVQG